MRDRKRRLAQCLKQTAVILVALAVYIVTAIPSALAAGTIDLSRDVTLSIQYDYNGKAIPGALFRLYRVADVSETVQFSLCGEFADYPVNLENLDSSGWTRAANTLSVHASADQITPIRLKETDREGEADFGTLIPGLYLLTVDSRKIGNDTYQSAPSLICLPDLNTDDTWNYHVVLQPKCAVESPEIPDRITVIKVWNDEGHKNRRPKSIEVALLRDEEVYSTAVLNESNYWRHTWKDLSGEHDWSVVERRVPNGYWVSYSGNSTVLTVYNDYFEEIPDDPTPGGNTSSEPENPNETVTIPDEEVPLAKLPQTGQLWWPVPIMAIAGLLLFSIGWLYNFRKRERQK